MLNQNIHELIMPENLELGMMVQRHRQRYKQGDVDFDYHAFVLGQSPFHTPYPIQEALSKSAHQSFYSPAKGIEALTQEIIGFHQRHFGLSLTSDRIVIGNGTKKIMFMLMSMLDGHYIVPSPAWIGYVPLLKYLNKSYETHRLSHEHDYKITPDQLDALMRKTDKTPIFVLNNPHNPTGALYTESELIALAKVCRKHQAYVISDEIYALVTYHQKDFVTMASIYPERTFVTNGISKDRSAAGYRLGTCILPIENTPLIKDKYVAFASTLYTNVATPIQHAAIKAYSHDEDIHTYINTTRSIHHMVGDYFYGLLSNVRDIQVSKPLGGFYFVVDFNPLKPLLNKHGIFNAHDLTYALLKEPYHIALVMGESIALDGDDLLARIAFIDYPGEAVYHAYQANTPSTEIEIEVFIQTHLAHMHQGFNRMMEFIEHLKT